MMSKLWLVLVGLSPLGSSSEAAYFAPLPPSQSSPKPAPPVDPKPLPKPPEGAPNDGLAGPPVGLRFEYLTPMDFASADAVSGLMAKPSSSGNGVELGFHISWRDRDRNLAYQGQAYARVKLARGARIRWLDCAIQTMFTKNGQASATASTAEFAVTATLLHARYADHPDATPPFALATLKLTKKANDVEGMDFVKGVAVDHLRGTVSDDGWHYVELTAKQSGAGYVGLRACRIGYLP